MIKYALRCEFDHGFEAWFSNSDAYDDQSQRGLIECPHCGSKSVSKAIMAPAVKTSKPMSEDQNRAMMRHLAEAAHQFRQAVEANCDYVGKDFATEARDMHVGLIPERPIYGEASPEEVKVLKEEGVPVMPIPRVEDIVPRSEAIATRNSVADKKLN